MATRKEEAMLMQLEEAIKLIQAHEWSPIVRVRKGNRYLYARKWGHKEQYIAPYRKLSDVTEEQVLATLARNTKKTKK